MRNPFKDRIRREQFEAVVRMFDARDKGLFLSDGSPHRGNGFASNFWKGYDPKFAEMLKVRWDAASKQTNGYIFFVAGEACRREDETKGRPLLSLHFIKTPVTR